MFKRSLLLAFALAACGPSAPQSPSILRVDGYPIDTADPSPIWARIPTAFHSRLHLIQLIGPTKRAWLQALEREGLEVITYFPENGYVVRGDMDIPQFRERFDFVQFAANYEPAFKIAPELRSPLSGTLELIIQVVDGPEIKETLHALEELSGAPILYSEQAQQYRNITLRADASRIAELAQLDDVFAVEPQAERRRLDEAQGQILAGNLSGGSPTGPGYQAFVDAHGFTSAQFGTFVVEIADDSHLVTGHPDLPSARVVFQNNPTGDSSIQTGHGFLNTQIVAGSNNGTGTAVEDANGYNYGLGVAPYARVGVTDVFGSTMSSATAWENTAYAAGARISSNSWGYSGRRRYDAYAQQYDNLVRDAQPATGLQPLLIVFAAGNDGPSANTVASPGTAKNVITVGASENVRTGTDGCGVDNSGADNANDLTSFSSRGPVNSAGGDGRVKPDLVAPGTHIQAGIPQGNYNGTGVCNQYFPSGQTLYSWSSGTSHACPAVAGGSALVLQNFLNQSLGNPSPAMIKAYLINSAAYLTGANANDTLPSNNQGMGRMDLGRAFDGTPRMYVDQTHIFANSGETHVVSGFVSDPTKPFRVTLAWSDASGPTTGAPWVNNLDLTVAVGGTTYKGNVFSGGTSVAGGAADTKNNVESVFLPAGTGGAFTVTVTALNIAGNGVLGNSDPTDQNFALVIYNGAESAPPPPVTIGVSPSSFSFSAVAGGANPASQTLSITNSAGGGALVWTATVTPSWLSISALAGSAPSTVDVSASVAALSAGTYTGQVTITAPGASNSPLVVPVTLVVDAAELIANGGFETQLLPWTLGGRAAFWTGSGSSPHTGTGYAFLGAGQLNAGGSVWQQLTIPAGASTANLTYWLKITTAETTTTLKNDKLTVEVRDTAGVLISTLATYSNLNAAAFAAYTQGALSLLPWAGQTIRIYFRVVTNTSLDTTFYLDDVSVR